MKKTVVITGGSRGIGRATVEKFAQEGYNVAFCYEKNEQAARNITERFPDVLAIRADVSKETDVSTFFDKVINKWEKIDCAVACAGISQISLFTDITEQQFDRVCGVNFKGTFLTLRYAARQMIRQKQGSIVTLSSMWGEVGGSCESVYSATKAAVIGLTKALAKELGPSGIRVNCVSPGVIDTDMNGNLSQSDISALCEQTPLCRIGNPGEVADLIYYLCGTNSSFITGQVISAGGGIVI